MAVRKSHIQFDKKSGQASRLNNFLPLFGDAGGVSRFVTAGDQSFRSGVSKVNLGKTLETFFWYDELWYVISGSGTLRTVYRPSGRKQNFTVNKGDMFYIPAGTWLLLKSVRTGSQEGDLVSFYVAVPSSGKNQAWIRSMKPRDMTLVKSRGHRR